MENLEHKVTSRQCAEHQWVATASRYEKPILIFYGDVRDITLGGTGAVLESGVVTGCRPNGQPNRDCLP